MRLTATLLILGALILAPLAPTRAYTLQYTSASAATQIHWPATNITIALSASLNNPPSYVHATGAQVVLAARRALSRWALASNIQFTVTASSNLTAGQDGVSLITIAPENANQFSSTLQPGRAFVFFDPNTGLISEADLAINPNVTTGTGAASFFSTDGTPGSYDLESTFTHEIGHMLGLEHSGLVSATMQPRQGTNGTFNLPNFTTRTLSSDDVAAIRSIYGPRTGLGSLAGRVTSGSAGLFGAHVFAEDVATGRVYAGNVTLLTGNYRIDSLPPGQYRVVAEPLDEPVNVREIPSSGGAYSGLQGGTTPFLTTEAGTTTVNADATTTLPDISVQGGTTNFNPAFIGTGSSGQLSTVAVPVVPGQTMTVLVGGDNLSLIPSNGVSINSPFITVSPVQQLGFFGSVSVISFDITPSVLTPPGEYSVRLQSSAGQVAYVSGGLTVDLPNGVPAAGPNLIDSTQFFVAQHYRDFLSREPDAAGLQFWTNNIESCGADAACRAAKRVDTSAAFFLSIEFQNTGYLVYRIYRTAFGNLPGKPVPVTFQQFFPDTQGIGRGVVVGQGDWQTQLETNKQAYALAFVQRPDFLAAHGNQDAATLVNSLFANAGVTPTAAESAAAIDAFNKAGGGNLGRAAALRSVAESNSISAKLSNEAFVLMQYFGYLRRNPDDPPDADFSGYNFWLAKLNQFNGNYINAQMVQAFLSAIEYRQRFGPA